MSGKSAKTPNFTDPATEPHEPPKRPKLANILEGVSKRMKADFDHISDEIEHNLSKGKERERVLVQEFLKTYLPHRFGLANGEIVSTDGQVSSECDVIIYDATTCPVLKEDGYQIIPVEAAYAVIEVKSNLTTNELLKSAKNIEAIKRMPKVAFYQTNSVIKRTFSLYDRQWDYFPMLGFVFAYTSIDLDILSAELDQFNQTIPPEYRIDYVCVLKSGGLIHVLPPPEGMKLYAQKNTRVGNLRSDNPLKAFLVVLQNLVLQSWTDPVRLGDYLRGESLGEPRYPSDIVQNPPPQGET
jgi:hypothetical protein